MHSVVFTRLYLKATQTFISGRLSPAKEFGLRFAPQPLLGGNAQYRNPTK